MNKLTQVVVAFALFGVAASAMAAKLDSVVNINNDSSWSIHELYISSADDDEWGPDQLGSEVIDSGGGSFQLHSIPCDNYDVRLIDEDGDECIVSGVALCADQDDWQITDDDLLACQGESQ